jgi:two-component system cell cycle sensor histidine kinase PleC
MSPVPLLQWLIRRCAAMSAGVVTAIITATAIVLAVPIGLGVWEVIVWAGMPVLAAMLALTALVVAVPLAGFLALALAWGWQQQQALSLKEDILRSAQRMAKVGHWRWTLGTDYYLVSEDACPLYGLSSDNPRLHLDALFEILHPGDHAAVREALRVLLQEHRAQELEYRLRNARGDYHTVWIDGRCEYDAHGTVVSIFGVIQDITERKRIENDLRGALERAEEASRAKSVFLASMSHELRTPLNAVLGFSEMIRDERLGPVANARYAEYAGDIHDSGTHLLALIDGLLDVSKIEAGRYELREESLNSTAVIERAVRTVQPAAARKGQRIELDLPNPAPVVRADERSLHQILLNLLSNAIKFSHMAGVITVRATADADGIAIAVEDRGIGIPDDKLAQVGKPFFQAHVRTARIAGGTGIGLSVTRSLVELHGGTLSIASRYGMGTVVTVRLPASRLLHSASAA